MIGLQSIVKARSMLEVNKLLTKTERKISNLEILI